MGLLRIEIARTHNLPAPSAEDGLRSEVNAICAIGVGVFNAGGERNVYQDPRQPDQAAAMLPKKEQQEKKQEEQQQKKKEQEEEQAEKKQQKETEQAEKKQLKEKKQAEKKKEQEEKKQEKKQQKEKKQKEKKLQKEKEQVGRAVGPRLMSGCGPGSRATCSAVLFGVLEAYPPVGTTPGVLGEELVTGYRMFMK
jgi:hypothetical protein